MGLLKARSDNNGDLTSIVSERKGSDAYLALQARGAGQRMMLRASCFARAHNFCESGL